MTARVHDYRCEAKSTSSTLIKALMLDHFLCNFGNRIISIATKYDMLRPPVLVPGQITDYRINLRMVLDKHQMPATCRTTGITV